MNWLDPQTKEILQKAIEPKLSPPKVAEFALVLVRKGADHGRLVRAICRINDCDEAKAAKLAGQGTPLRVNSDLSEKDAHWGQLELICCDAISIFIRSQVLDRMELADFQELLQRTSQSTEFRPATVTISEIPLTEAGLGFIDQFLGISEPAKLGDLPSKMIVPLKKARFMQHWATRVGASVQCQTE